MSAPDMHWTGASGKKYGYWEHKLPYNCKPGQDGNYIFSKLIGGIWYAVYIGEGDINDRVNEPEHYQCATKKGATHVHVHTQANEQGRLAEEQDLLAGNPEAYDPTGCNQKDGG